MIDMVFKMVVFKCLNCGYKTSKPLMICPRCNGLMRPVYRWIWRPLHTRSINGFKTMLPRLKQYISLGEGWSPLISSKRMFSGRIYFKDEGRNPTGSFRDRAASLIVSHAYEEGYKRIILASDGNMGVSVSAYAARVGIETIVYVPKNTDPEKILLMKAYGARTIIRDEPIDQLLVKVEKEAEKKGYYNASSTYNTLSIDGLKTISYELFLDGVVPTRIYLPLGSGLTLLSIYWGFKELLDHGYIKYIPRLIGVETCGNPVYGMRYGLIDKPCNEKSFPGLSYREPIILKHVLDVIKRYGEIRIVSRRMTIEAAKKLSKLEGLFVEPSSAVALAGALEDQPSEAVILLTGHGLKGPGIYLRGSRLREPRIFPGSTKYLILEILLREPGLTGYEVWRKLGLNITLQAVYQHLHDLEEKKLVISRIVGNKRRYYPTEKTNKLLEMF